MDQKEEKQTRMIRQNQAVQNPPPPKRKGKHQLPKFLLSIFGWFRRSPFMALCVLLVLASLSFCLFIAPAFGAVAGTAIGSWRGVTQGIAEGAEAGKEAGLSAEDTTVKIGNKMVETGNLQVMRVDLRLTDLYQQGNDYAALWSMQGEGIFFVNLAQSKVFYNKEENEIKISIPEPNPTFDFNESTVKLLAEYQRLLFNGSTADGYRGYLNSNIQVKQKAQKEMQAMLEPAKNSALIQVEQLARSVCGSSASVQVDFIEEEG